jgi:hypothetical protein
VVDLFFDLIAILTTKRIANGVHPQILENFLNEFEV